MPEGQEIPGQEPSQATITENKKADSTLSPDKEIGQTLAERHPDWPPVKVKFYFSSHVTAEDMAGMKEHMPDANIYLYESGGGNSFTQFYQEVANAPGSNLYGDNVEQVMKNTSIEDKPLENTPYESIIRSLYGSKVIVGHIDLRESEADLDQEIRAEFGMPYIDEDFDKTLTNIKEDSKKIAQLQDAREKVMVKRFEEELEDIFKAHPELKDKTDLKILATMGSIHTPLHHKFQGAGIDTERVFPNKPYIYNYDDQAMREFMFDREPSQEVLARKYLEATFRRGLEMEMIDKVSSSDVLDVYLRNVSSRFSVEDIRKIHAAYISESLTIPRLNGLLWRKGFDPLPRTNEELKRHVEKQKKGKKAPALDT